MCKAKVTWWGPGSRPVGPCHVHPAHSQLSGPCGPVPAGSQGAHLQPCPPLDCAGGQVKAPELSVPGQLCRTAILAGNRHSSGFPPQRPSAGLTLIAALQLPRPQPLQPPPPVSQQVLPPRGEGRNKGEKITMSDYKAPTVGQAPGREIRVPPALKAPLADKPLKRGAAVAVGAGARPRESLAGRWVALPGLRARPPRSRLGKAEAPWRAMVLPSHPLPGRLKEKGGGLLRKLGGRVPTNALHPGPCALSRASRVRK